MNRFRFIGAAIITLFFLTIAVIPVYAQPASLSNTEAEIRAAEWYAKDQGIDVAEAMRRLQLMHAEEYLQAKLEEKAKDVYAGLWVQHKPEFRIIAAFTRDGETIIRPYIEKGPWANLVDVRIVSTSLAELQAEQVTVQQIVSNLRVPFNAAINVKENRVEVYVTDTKLLDGTQLPRNTVVIKVDELPKPEAAQIWAGERISGCTTGFGVRDASGNKYITTAAHCSRTQSYNGTTLTWVGERRGGSYDIAWYRAGSLTVTNYVNVPGGRSSISGVKRRAAFLIGEQVCMYGGYSTPNYQCGYIQSKTYLYDGQSTWILVQNPGVDLSRGGDSGAPWFWGNTAYGMHVAGAGNDAIFMATDYFDSAGVYILTSCPFC